MVYVFNLALHVLLVGSLLVFIVGLVSGAVTEPDPRERILRIAALVAGALVTLGAQASGVGFAEFTVDSLAGARPASALAHLGAVVFPAALGAGLGFYVVRVFRRSERIAMRVLGFIGMLASTAFLEIYAEATHVNGVFLGAAALPNVSFVAGVILTIVFTDDPDKSPGASRDILGLLLNRRGAGATRGVDRSSAFGTGTAGAARDPFAD